MILDFVVAIYGLGLVLIGCWYQYDGIEENNEAFVGSMLSMMFWPITVVVVTINVIREENWRN